MENVQADPGAPTPENEPLHGDSWPKEAAGAARATEHDTARKEPERKEEPKRDEERKEPEREHK